jgi:hypothetical protein
MPAPAGVGERDQIPRMRAHSASPSVWRHLSTTSPTVVGNSAESNPALVRSTSSSAVLSAVVVRAKRRPQWSTAAEPTQAPLRSTRRSCAFTASADASTKITSSRGGSSRPHSRSSR